MDNILINLFGEIPLITKIWTCGIVCCMICLSTNIIELSSILYSYDLVFRKHQYIRLVYSFVDFGKINWSTFLSIFVTINHLSNAERAINSNKRFIWIIIFQLLIIIFMSRWIQPLYSLGMVLQENIIYYKVRRDYQMNLNVIGVFNMSPLILSIYSNLFMYFIYGYSIWQILINFIPGHIYYFIEVVLSKIYQKDLGQPPDEWLK